DVRSQVLTTTGLLILQWEDERLRWEPYKYNNLTEITIEAKRLWQPEFVVINGAERVYKRYGHFRAILNHDGAIRWEPGGAFKTMCQIDITYYPFDDQTCSLVFGAWSYQTSNMNLTSPSAKIHVNVSSCPNLYYYDLCRQRNEFFYECTPKERFSNVAFRIRLRRRYTYYILNVILPSILTSVLLLSIFFCTPGQKVQIGVVVLLSFRIFLLNVADNIPKTSDHVPLLGIYLTCTMAITTLSMVLTVFVLNLHHMGDRPVPPWVSNLVLIHVARAVGVGA
ncbi:Neuronal acetylcholine receptor subunit alpha-4, partial [Lamellibrachia satsuma]